MFRPSGRDGAVRRRRRGIRPAMPRHRARPAGRRDQGHGRGQVVVQFAMVIPLFILILVATIEFVFVLNAQLSITYATRNGALLAAEAGTGPGADCAVLRSIEGDAVTGEVASVSPPAQTSAILSVEIYLSDQNGTPIPAGNPKRNIWTRTGSTACGYPANLAYTVPYTLTTAGYPEASRCNNHNGCALQGGNPVIDTVGVRITYAYTWHTPLSALLAWTGGGWTLVQSNATRMEPVL